MSTNYPTSLDSFTNPTSGQNLNSPSHSEQHANANDSIEALEAKVGADSSAVTTSHDYKLGEVTGTDKAVGKTATQTLTNKTLSTGVKLDTNADQNITYYGMARQAIMNGNFDIWQRGTSASVVDVLALYRADRWVDYADKNGGTLPTLTRSRQLLTSGDIPNAFYFTRLATNGAGTSLGVYSYHAFQEKIENGTRNLCGVGKKVTVSFWARSSITNKKICPTLWQNYGTGGSPTAQEIILGTPITLTSTWTEYTATFTTNTLVGKTFGTNVDDCLILNLWHMWGSAYGNSYIQTGVTAETYVGAGNIDIAQVQLCAGDVALPFQPKSYEEELRACQRYYENCYTRAYGYGVNGATFFTINCYYKVSKRITPSVTVSSESLSGLTYNSVETRGDSYIRIYMANVTGSVTGNYLLAVNAEL